MQVNVFVTQPRGELGKRLLVLPIRPSAAVPLDHRDEWVYFATVDTGDKLLAASKEKVEADLASKGHSVVDATG